MTFYRCMLCGNVVSLFEIKSGAGCSKCSSPRVMPTNLSGWEKLVQIIKHPLIWRWPDDPK